APTTSETSTLSLHDALPILGFVILSASACGKAPTSATYAGPDHVVYGTDDRKEVYESEARWQQAARSTLAVVKSDRLTDKGNGTDRKSTRLNSSHRTISYAV